MDSGKGHYLEIELWDKIGNRIADISKMADSRAFSVQLNGVSTLQFSLDGDKFATYCASLNVSPRTLLWPLQTEVRVKLGGTYWLGFIVAAVTPYLNETGSTLSVRCSDPLDLLSKRFVTKTYTQLESTAVAWDLINTTQSQTNGSLGVTMGSQQFPTGVLRDRQYEQKSVKDALVELTRLETGTFDFRFTHDKQFETYEALGSVRTSSPLVYGPGGNIKSVELPTEGMSISNKVIGLGSGFGADQVTSIKSDSASQLNYVLLEEIVQYSDITTQSVLDENTAGHLKLVKDILQIPRITVSANALDLQQTSVGDRVPVNLTANAYTSNVNGLYRIEQMDIQFDENDFANDITLQFDNQGVDPNESA